MHRNYLLEAFAIATILLFTPAHGQTSVGSLSLQGRVSGVADGTSSLQIRFYDTASGGMPIGTTPWVNSSVSRGVFSAVVVPPANMLNGLSRWWSAVVDGDETGPRQLVTTVPYAIRAGTIVDQNGYAIIGNGLGTARLGVNTTPAAMVHIQQFDQNASAIWVEGRVQNDPAPPIALVTILDQDNTPARTGGVALLEKTGDFAHNLIKAYYNGSNKLVLSNSGELWIADNASVPTLTIRGGSDLAEPFPASPSPSVEPKPGLILSIDPEHPGALRVSTEAYDTKVAGVYSGANGLATGMIMGQDGCGLTGSREGSIPLAMTGRVWVYADESAGDIRAGDRLTTSGLKPGYATKVTDSTRADGAVIGKAMMPVDPETGMALVNLQ